MALRLNKLIFLFWTTLVVGALSALAIGLILQISDHEFGFMGYKGMGFSFTTMVMGGLMFSVLSQMGFFAYLMINYIALSIFRRKYLWLVTQVIIIVIVLFDLVYLPYLNFNEGEGWASYLIVPAILVAVSVGVTFWKVQMTNPTAWIPCLFFMIAATSIEAVPGVQQNNWA
ncbi:MAG TPA: KinB-signaling pathway activation protein, partial [Bacilli bacterium]